MGKKTKIGKTRKDKFYQLAKETGFRSRSAFKLIQLNRKFGFLQESQVCIDLCAAPGGWMQVAKKNMPISSIVIGVDLFPIKPIAGCISLVEDITTDKCKSSLTKELQTWKADVVLHDGAPNVGKNWLFDAYQQICLTLQALKLSTNFLRSNGWFVTKIFRSKDYNALLWVLKQLFKKVHATKPSASRKESAEIFVVCQGYLAPTKIDPKLMDPKYVFEELELESKKPSLLHPEKIKRIKAEGYSENEVSLRNEMSVMDFIQEENALGALQGVGSIIVDNEEVKSHPKTTTEILECCKDIKVLGRKDIKGLILWHKNVRADIIKTENKVEDVEVEKPKEPLTGEELEDLEMEELDKEIANLNEEEQKEAKRKKKKMLKERSKLNEKMNLKMVIKDDDGPHEEDEDEIFLLKDIKNKEDLEALQDVDPDTIVDDNFLERGILPKYKKYEKDDKYLDDDGFVDDKIHKENENETESSDESNYEETGLGLSDAEEDNESKNKNKNIKKKKKEINPLLKSGDFRDKDTKRQQRVQLWYEKDNLNIVNSDDEECDLDTLAHDFKAKGVEVLCKDKSSAKPEVKVPLGKRAKRKARHNKDGTGSSSESSDSDSEKENKENDNEVSDKGIPNLKKIRLNEEELALGSMLVKGKKTRRDLIDAAWNRYTFNDENLPQWFEQDEDVHMRQPIPVPPEIAEEYKKKVEELNARPIKKVMEAKARKKRRAKRRLEKAKKKAEQIMEHSDGTAQDKIRQIKKLYKKTEEKKKDIAYVVAKKHLAGKRVRRPPGVKGRFRVVDPRMKKEKRAKSAKERRNKKTKRG